MILIWCVNTTVNRPESRTLDAFAKASIQLTSSPPYYPPQLFPGQQSSHTYLHPTPLILNTSPMKKLMRALPCAMLTKIAS